MSKTFVSLFVVLASLSASAANYLEINRAAVTACQYETNGAEWCRSPIGPLLLSEYSENGVTVQEDVVDFVKPETQTSSAVGYRANIVVVDGKIVGVEFRCSSCQ